jgi:hypothetical protein
MNEDKNVNLKNIAKYGQILLNDGILIKSKDTNIATIERSNLVKLYIKLIRSNLDIVEKEANSTK